MNKKEEMEKMTEEIENLTKKGFERYGEERFCEAMEPIFLMMIKDKLLEVLR